MLWSNNWFVSWSLLCRRCLLLQQTLGKNQLTGQLCPELAGATGLRILGLEVCSTTAASGNV